MYVYHNPHLFAHSPSHSYKELLTHDADKILMRNWAIWRITYGGGKGEHNPIMSYLFNILQRTVHYHSQVRSFSIVMLIW